MMCVIISGPLSKSPNPFLVYCAMYSSVKTICLIGILAVLGARISLGQGVSVLSYHNDSVSSGVNSFETVLTPANLTVGTFSKQFSTGVDGQVYAQPLYVPSVTVTGGAQAGTHNLILVATQHDSLYAIDADSGIVVWKDSFLASGLPGATAITTVPSGDVNSSDTFPEIGICGTPVIDGATNLLYVAAKTKQIVNGATGTPNYVYTLYQVDLTNGNATANANIVNSAVIGDTVYNGSTYTYRTNADPTAAQDPFVPGTGDGGDHGQQPKPRLFQRSAGDESARADPGQRIDLRLFRIARRQRPLPRLDAWFRQGHPGPHGGFEPDA